MRTIKYTDGAEEQSGVTGYITSLAEENFKDYLKEYLSEDQVQAILSWLQERKITQFALLRDIWVDYSDRGKGVGTRLLLSFLNEAQGLPVLLINDGLQLQQEGFILLSWYQKHGFEVTPFRILSGPILIRF